MTQIMINAALNTLLGMGTVFLVLIFISLLIGCFKYINMLEQKIETVKASMVSAEITASAAEMVMADEKGDLELVAVISAAIAAYEGTSADSLVVRSIRRTPGNKWKRA